MSGPEELVHVVVVPPGRMRCFAIHGAFRLAGYCAIDGCDDVFQEVCWPIAFLEIIVALQCLVRTAGHVVEDVAEAFRHESKVGCLSPDEEVEARVDKAKDKMMVLGFLAQEGAPFPVILEQLAMEEGDGAVYLSSIIMGSMAMAMAPDLLLGSQEMIREEEHDVLTLVPHIILLEAELAAEPIHDIVWQRRRR